MEKGYCMKCRMKRDMKGVKNVIKSKRRFATGTCSKCGTKMYKILGMAKKK